MKSILLTICCASMALTATAQDYDFDLTRQQPVYHDSIGYGYDIIAAPDKKSALPFYFSVKVPDGNYRVAVTIGNKKRAAQTVVRAESRRLLQECTATKKGELKTLTFTVSKFSDYIDGKKKVGLKKGDERTLNWDDRLTLEFNGPAPAVSHLTITPDTTATTIYLCGNSTVTDQDIEPWASWGQMAPRWFNDHVTIANYARSGLTATSFYSQNRLEKILSTLKARDYVLVEFGHNDQKEKGPGTGAWYHFSHILKKYVDLVRQKGATIIFVTPTQRRFFHEGNKTIKETHGDFPDAMRAVARREGVPVIELHDMTRAFFETLGYNGSKQALVHYPAGTFPGQEKPLADNTHFNTYGAYEVSKMIVMGMKQLNLPIVRDLRPDWQDYSPTLPDDAKAFLWYPPSRYNITKPDGN
ncbi:MAG: rhamnogalacturonan acetylesterase [Prevotella sp.]|nr:rhamnogalacturonan acetylesterase [Prevotella sp.]